MKLTEREFAERQLLRAYVRDNGLERAPVMWQVKTFRDWLKRQAKPKPIKRSHTRPTPSVVPEPTLAPIPTGAKLPRVAIVERLSAFIAAGVELILENNFDPGVIQQASRDSIEGFANVYSVKPKMQDLQEARPRAVTKLQRNYFRADVERALSFLFQDLAARIGMDGIRESKIQKNYWENIRAIRKSWQNNRPSNGGVAALINRLTPVAYGNDRKPISEIVRQSVGLESRSTIRLQPNPADKPRFRPLNSDKQANFEIVNLPDGRTVYKMPDGTTFQTWAVAEQYIAATQNLEARAPARVS